MQPGGYLAITPSPGELPPIGGVPWLVSVAEDADGAMRSGDADLLIVAGYDKPRDSGCGARFSAGDGNSAARSCS